MALFEIGSEANLFYPGDVPAPAYQNLNHTLFFFVVLLCFYKNIYDFNVQ